MGHRVAISSPPWRCFFEAVFQSWARTKKYINIFLVPFPVMLIVFKNAPCLGSLLYFFYCCAQCFDSFFGMNFSKSLFKNILAGIGEIQRAVQLIKHCCKNSSKKKKTCWRRRAVDTDGVGG